MTVGIPSSGSCLLMTDEHLVESGGRTGGYGDNPRSSDRTTGGGLGSDDTCRWPAFAADSCSTS